MKTILIATEKPFAPVAVEAMRSEIETAGLQCRLLEKYTSPEQLADAAATADAIIIRSDKVTAQLLSAAPQLKLVVRAGAGYDNVDLAAAAAAGVVVENTPGQNSNAVAELVFGMLIMAMRNMYDGTSGCELRGKTLGIHAFGQVGRNVARIAKGFDMTVSALDPFCPDEVIARAGVTPIDDIRTLYRSNRVVSLHIPATPQTVKSVGYDLLTLMPKGGILVNTARKEVIDEEGLLRALTERPDLKYVADIRPDNADTLLSQYPGRVFFTPKKMGAQTAEANINAGIAAARQAVAFINEGKVMFQVNKP